MCLNTLNNFGLLSFVCVSAYAFIILRGCIETHRKNAGLLVFLNRQNDCVIHRADYGSVNTFLLIASEASSSTPVQLSGLLPYLRVFLDNPSACP